MNLLNPYQRQSWTQLIYCKVIIDHFILVNCACNHIDFPIVLGVETSHQFMLSKITELTAICAINVGEFAFSCDFSRCRLKQSQNNNENKKNGMEGMWMIRALSFAAMGKIH